MVGAGLRRDEFDAEARVKLFAELAGYFRARAAVPAEMNEPVADEQFVRNVVDVLYVNWGRGISSAGLHGELGLHSEPGWLR